MIMKWYLVRNHTSDTLTMKDLLDDASRGKWSIRGGSRLENSEEVFNALALEGLFKGHSESIVRIIEYHDKEKGVYIEKGLWEGERSRFIIRKIESPRHIWSDKPLVVIEEDEEEEFSSE